MIDPLTAVASALTARSPAAFGLVFLAGVITSAGPCVAPRYIAVAAIANNHRRSIVPTLAFVAGVIAAFVTLGFVAGLVGELWPASRALYLVLAVGLVTGGAIALVRAVPTPDHHCGSAIAANGADRTQSLGAIVLLGAGSTLVISPCCTPVVASVAAMSTAIGKPALGVALLATYAVGHALPLFMTGGVAALLRRVVPAPATGQAPAIIGAGLMLALGLYYGILA